MSVWVLSDLHLAFGSPDKSMEAFGPSWAQYTEKIEAGWKATVTADDLILIPGDISWSMTLTEALIDLRWIATLPGTKLLLRGNHDYWWSSSAKMTQAMPPSIHFIHNNAFNWKGISIGGSRLWDTHEYRFTSFVEFRENPRARIKSPEELAKEKEEEEKIFIRELDRLVLSLSQLDKHAKHRIAMTHYPPIGADLQPSRASAILERFQIDTCVFGHLHNIRPDTLPFGKARGINYIFASADYLQFHPLKIY